jgi:hypothetical protein
MTSRGLQVIIYRLIDLLYMRKQQLHFQCCYPSPSVYAAGLPLPLEMPMRGDISKLKTPNRIGGVVKEKEKQVCNKPHEYIPSRDISASSSSIVDNGERGAPRKKNRKKEAIRKQHASSRGRETSSHESFTTQD